MVSDRMMVHFYRILRTLEQSLSEDDERTFRQNHEADRRRPVRGPTNPADSFDHR